MKNTARLFCSALFVAGILGITGCEDHQERYETPPWLGGTSIEILQQRGNYNTFLSLMEKANYTEPITKQLFTLFVPDDQAFKAYFQSAGKNSVENLTKEEAVQLFTLHVLRNPRSRFQLIYEYAWAELQGPKGEYASLFNRKETPSTTIPYRETIKYLPGRVGEELLIYSDPKYVSLFTAEWFDNYGGTADGSDYLFMYPGSTWRKGYPDNMKGMNWHGAMIIPNPEIPEELEVRTASGFIYFLDRVVEPMPSVEEYLKNHPEKFGVYYDILQRFAKYGSSKTDEQKRVLYKKSYDLVNDLADEKGYGYDPAVPPRNLWTAFLPSNAILQKYLDNTVLKYYTSLNEVPSVTLYYILQTQLSSTLVLLSKMEKNYFNAFGDPTPISRKDIVNSYMCSNGLIYETNRVLEPNVFTSVPGILFIDKNYLTLLYILDKAGMIPSLAKLDADVTLFATTNEKLEEYGIRYNATNASIENRGPLDGVWRTMNTTELNMFAQDQIYKGKLSDISGPGGFVELASGNFLHYANNVVEAAENQATKTPANVQQMVNEKNGLLVKVDKPVESRVVMGKLLYGNLSDPELSDFTQLLIDSKLLDQRFRDAVTRENIPNLKFLAAAKYWTAFIPTNAAMAKAREQKIIPYTFPKSTAGKDSIDRFIKYHFVVNDVIFDDGKQNGNFDTYFTYTDPFDPSKTLSAKLKVTNAPLKLSVTDVSGQVVDIDHKNANLLVRKGVVHKINSVLKYYK